MIIKSFFLSSVFCTQTNFAFSCFVFVLFSLLKKSQMILMLGREGEYFCFGSKQGINSKPET